MPRWGWVLIVITIITLLLIISYAFRNSFFLLEIICEAFESIVEILIEMIGN